jgi:hypothetical protein
MPDEQKVEPRIVEAVFTSSNASKVGLRGEKSPLAGMIEQAMAAAVEKAYAEGISDPETIRDKMLSARKAAKEMYNAAVAKAMEELKRAEQQGNPTG